MNLEIVVATNNQHKMKEYREIFKDCPIVFYSLKDLNLDVDVEENGKTYKENALIKAKAIAKIVKFPVISDDSGLEVHALNNEPGIYTARFAKKMGGQTNANLEIIKRVSNFEDKTATFKCAIALITKEDELVFEGECNGYILDRPEGNEGFGYDPIFYSNEAKMCMGTAPNDIKNKYSHRAKASKKLITYLKIKDFKLE